MTCALQLANVIQKFQNVLLPDNNACQKCMRFTVSAIKVSALLVCSEP